MKKIICKKEYDTETATLIKAYSCGKLGDPTGYEEDLYQTPEGLYFLHVGGGETSIYVWPRPRSTSGSRPTKPIHRKGVCFCAGSFLLYSILQAVLYKKDLSQYYYLTNMVC